MSKAFKDQDYYSGNQYHHNNTSESSSSSFSINSRKYAQIKNDTLSFPHPETTIWHFDDLIMLKKIVAEHVRKKVTKIHINGEPHKLETDTLTGLLSCLIGIPVSIDLVGGNYTEEQKKLLSQWQLDNIADSGTEVRYFDDSSNKIIGADAIGNEHYCG